MGENAFPSKKEQAMIPSRLSSASLLTLCLAATASAQVKINEIRVEQTGPDLDEYVELQGPPGTNLAGYFYLVIGNDDFALPPGQNGSVEEVIALSGTIPANGLFVIAKPSFTLGAANLVVPFVFEGGNNKTHLLVQDFAGAIGDDLDTNDDGVIDPPAPWSSVSDSIALIQYPNPDGVTGDFVYAPTQIGPDAGVIPSQVWRCSDTGAWRIGFFVVGISDTPGVANPACEGSQLPIRISEIRIDETGSDNSEYFELSGTPGAVLDGLTYIVIGDGNAAQGSGVIEAIVPLTGSVLSGNGLFLVAETTFVLPGIPNLVVGASGLNFENSDNVTHLLVRDFTGTANSDIDTDNDGVLDSTPWSEILDSVALVKTTLPAPRMGDEWWYGPVRVGPDGTFVPGHIYRCQPNGDWQIGAFDPGSIAAADTPGSANLACEACGVIGGGNCFLAHASSGCEDESCCNSVCVADPTCCSSEWDAACVTLAQQLCHVAGPAPALKISEVRIDEPGTDLNEYVELVGAPGTSLNGVAYVVLGQGPGDVAGVVESVTKLDGVTVSPNGTFVFAKPSFTLSAANLVVPSNGFTFNANTSKTHLLVWNLETIRGEDLDFDNDCGLDRLGWVSIIDQVVFTGTTDPAICVYGAPALGPDCNGFAPAHLFRCLRTDEWTVGSFSSTRNDTPGAANVACDVSLPIACGDECAGDCLTAHDTRSCSNGTCCEVVCSLLPECCDIVWDATCVTLASQTSACTSSASPIVINEIRTDEPGVDNNESFELVGAPNASLKGLTYIVIGDSPTVAGSGFIEAILPLDGNSLNASGLFLVVEPTFALSGTPDLVTAANGLNFENGDNVTHMIVRNFTGALDDDLDTNDDGVLDVTPWDSILDTIALVSTTQPAPSGASEWWYGQRIGPDGGTQPGHVYRCWPTGYWQIGLFNPVGGNDTPGAVNPTCDGYVACVPGPDRNGDGCVNGEDLAFVLGNWDPTGSLGNGFGQGDTDCNGVVDGFDLAPILGDWLQGCQ